MSRAIGAIGGRVEQALLDPPVERVEEVVRLGRAVRDQLAGDVRPVHEPGRDRVDRVAPAVRREVGARQLEHAGVVRPGVDGGDRLRPVARGRPRAAAGSCRRTSPFHKAGSAAITIAPTSTDDDERVPVQVAPVEPARRTPSTPAPSSTAAPSATSGTARPTLRSARPGGRAVGERLQQRAERRRVVVRVRADGDADADEHEDGEVDAVAPADERRREQRERRDGVAGQDERAALRVVDAGFDPVAELVAAVEEPVAEAAQHLGRDAGGRRRSSPSRCT